MKVFNIKEYKERIKKVKNAMLNKGIDILISQDTANMNYLTGYDACSFYMPQCILISLNEDCLLYTSDAADE